MSYSEDIYHLPNCGAIVVAQQKDDVLFLADVIAESPVSFIELAAELPFYNVRHVQFGFCPDWLGITPTWIPTDQNKDPFFIKGNLQMPEKFCIPVTSMT